MDKDKIHIDDEILAKFLAGEASTAEIDMVLNWVASSDDNINEFEQFQQVWSLSKTRNIRDTSKAWSKLNKQINRRRNFKLLYSGVAAAAVVLVVVLTQFIKYDSTDTKQQFAISSSKTPIDTSLPDGSEVQLSENSSIAYSFDPLTNTRTAALSGKAFFNIKRDTTQKFIVNTAYGGVEVLGTQFNVDVLENSDIQVDVLSGVVKLFMPQVSGDTLFLVITAKETAIISMQSDTIMKQTQIPSAFYRVNKTITFNNVDLNTIVTELQQCYTMAIKADSTVDQTLKFTSSFSDNSLEEILTVIAQTHNLTFVKKDDVYIIKNNEE